MTLVALALALASALLHAAWNVRLKSSSDPLRVAAVALPLGTAAATPVAGAVWLATGRPGLPGPAWALAALSGLLELGYFHTLSAAYRRGDVSSVYPVARGTAPVLAALVGVLALDERPAPAQLAGVAVLVAGVWLARPPSASRRALVPALLTGVLIAAYSTVDRLGVRLGPAWLYAWAVFAAISLSLLPWVRLNARGGRPPLPEPPLLSGTLGAPAAHPFGPQGDVAGPGKTDSHARAEPLLTAGLRTRREAWGLGLRGTLAGEALPVGLLTVLSYGLVLMALSLAPLALVAPLRESGVVAVALWGVFRLGERRRAAPKLGGAAAVVAGAILVAAG